MIASGYQILDLKKAPFAAGATEHTVTGAYNAIRYSNGKPLIVGGFVYDGAEQASSHAWYQIDNNGATISTDSGYSFSITPSDVVTVVAPVGG